MHKVSNLTKLDNHALAGPVVLEGEKSEGPGNNTPLQIFSPHPRKIFEIKNCCCPNMH